jgi:hypothetical protein
MATPPGSCRDYDIAMNRTAKGSRVLLWSAIPLPIVHQVTVLRCAKVGCIE